MNLFIYLKDHLTGKVSDSFATQYKPNHKIGGRSSSAGLKYFGCFAMNTCNQHGLNSMYEPLDDFKYD